MLEFSYDFTLYVYYPNLLHSCLANRLRFAA